MKIIHYTDFIFPLCLCYVAHKENENKVIDKEAPGPHSFMKTLRKIKRLAKVNFIRALGNNQWTTATE